MHQLPVRRATNCTTSVRGTLCSLF